MPISDEVSKRITTLDGELLAVGARERSLARSAYLWSQGLFISALLCSVAAAVCGLFFNIQGKIVGGIAALPPVIAFVATNLKLDARSSWHYRKFYVMQALHSRLVFQLPESPTVDNISAIASDRDKFVNELEEDWKKSAATSFADMLKAAEQIAKKPRSSRSSDTEARG